MTRPASRRRVPPPAAPHVVSGTSAVLSLFVHIHGGSGVHILTNARSLTGAAAPTVWTGAPARERRQRVLTCLAAASRPRSRSRTARAELSFSVSHVERLLREGRYSQRLSASAPVFLAAIIQYLTATVLQLAGDEARNRGRTHITPELVDMAVHNNALLSPLFGATTISQVAPGPN
ncbi:PREDICTED: histone H2A-Bbd type 2/3 [Condylura cristata]|uniref:histone H2A-Bbd type 2/3 n=1 Tax=Condylura cristata TaxID=143302 RepID=UPI000334443C|nr:PREDICTED: histone H2A-Bbd type 2/3 [Condylura cristata]